MLEKLKSIDLNLVVTLIFVFIVVGAILFLPDMTTVSPVVAKSTQRTCDFVDIDGTVYAFCDDGSEFRIADVATPDPKGQ